jgi:hypothetical protein
MFPTCLDQIHLVVQICIALQIHRQADTRARARTHTHTRTHTHSNFPIYTVIYSSLEPLFVGSWTQISMCRLTFSINCVGWSLGNFFRSCFWGFALRGGGTSPLSHSLVTCLQRLCRLVLARFCAARVSTPFYHIVPGRVY